jgi:ubiquinone/menaquinone biosynthesis C-methylase UbiE
MDHKDTVRESYNVIAEEYLATRAKKSSDIALLDEFTKYLDLNAKVLDAGCGAGIPVKKFLSEHFEVTGVNFSEKQIEFAKKNVPDATFICQDMTQLDFPENHFDGICSYYAIIHIPREEHRLLLENFYRMLNPNGVVLLCLGADDLSDDTHSFHGNQMYWSHYDAETNQFMLEEVGFNNLLAKIVPDESYNGKHLFVLAQKGTNQE